jgi:predicted dehydrogenase
VLWDILGPLTIEAAELYRDSQGYQLKTRLVGPGGAATLTERRGDGLSRGRTLHAHSPSGEVWQAEPERPEPGLFRSDLERFLSRVRSDGAEGVYLPDEDVLGVLRVADALSQGRTVS